MSDQLKTDTALHRYIEVEPAYYAAYEASAPDLPTLSRVAAARPGAHVLVVSRYTCSDCARNMPCMARIAERLPGWTWEIHPETALEVKEKLGISRVPTFVIFDQPEGEEIGRIVENPLHASLEADLWEIVSRSS
jgi:hypothetical protein